MLCLALEILVGLFILGVLAVAIFISMRGDCEMVFDAKKRGELVVDSVSEDRLDFSCLLPVSNPGKEEGTIIDTYMRIYLPDEQYDDLLLRGKVNFEGRLREDDYFECLLFPEGWKKNLVLRFEAYPRHGKTLKEALGNVPDVEVAFYADCRGRKDLFTKKVFFTLTSEELRALVK